MKEANKFEPFKNYTTKLGYKTKMVKEGEDTLFDTTLLA